MVKDRKAPRFDRSAEADLPPISVSVEEAARMSRLGRSLLYDCMSTGALPYVKVAHRQSALQSGFQV